MNYGLAISPRYKTATLNAGDTIVDLGSPDPFPVIAATDVIVRRTRAGVKTVLVLDADYAVSLLDQLPGARVTLSPALQDDVIEVIGARPIARTTDLEDGQKFNDDTLNAEFDALVLEQQEARRDIDRAVTSPLGEAGLEMPEYEGGKALVWSSTARKLISAPYSPGDITAAVEEVEALRDDTAELKQDTQDIRDGAANDAAAAIAAALAWAVSPADVTPGNPSAKTSAGVATAKAALTAADVVSTGAAKTAAETARDAALATGKMYPDTTAGLAGVASGSYFLVPSAVPEESFILYKNNAGAALETKRYPSATAVSKLSFALAPYGYAGAIVDDYGLAAIAFRTDGTVEINSLVITGVFAANSFGTPLGTWSDVAPYGYKWAIIDGNGFAPIGVRDDGAVAIKELVEVAAINGVAIAAYTGSGAGSSRSPGSFNAEINHIVGYGQSRSAGTDSVPAISTAQVFDSLMFVGGARPYDLGNVAADNFASLVALVESVNGILGETPMSGMMACIKERVLTEDGIAFGQQNYQMLASVHGVGGTAIAGLITGTTPFDRHKLGISYGYALAQAAGKSYKYRGFTWSQGESDYQANTPAATYETQLLGLRSDLDAYAKSVTGQIEDAYCFIDQLDDHGTYGHANDPYIALKQLEICKAQPRFVLSTPTYHLGVGVHHSNVNSKWLGAYHGVAYKRTIVDGVKWQPLRPVETNRQGVIILARFNVPGGKLTVDNVNVSATANMGFTLVNNVGTAIAVNSATIVGRDLVRIIAATAPPAGSKLRYAFAGQGNLRDSQGDSVVFDPTGINKPMHNWCVIFEETLA